VAELADGVYADFTSSCPVCHHTVWTVAGKPEPHACVPREAFETARAAVMDEMGWEDDRSGVAVDYQGLVWKQAGDLVQRVADVLLQPNDQHIIDLREDGWTLQHPLACRPNLFDCQLNRVAHADPYLREHSIGQFQCWLTDEGQLQIGEGLDRISAPDAGAVRWEAIVIGAFTAAIFIGLAIAGVFR